jgi:hypothetical protein
LYCAYKTVYSTLQIIHVAEREREQKLFLKHKTISGLSVCGFCEKFMEWMHDREINSVDENGSSHKLPLGFI